MSVESEKIKTRIPTPDGWFAMRYRDAIALVGFLIVTTNTVNTIITIQGNNTDAIEYNDKANSRRIQHAVDEMTCKYKIQRLEDKLKECETKQ